MTNGDHDEVAAEVMVEAALARENFAELHGRLGPAFGRVEPFRQAGKYIVGLMSDVPRKNGWTLAEHAGDRRPDAMQRLLNHASWDAFAAMAVVRGFVAERLCGGLAVMALDETGQEKKGEHTAGVKRQHMGCAGGVANGVNTVHGSYATARGHALAGARLYIPREQIEDAGRRDRLGIAADLEFKTKPQLAIEITADAIADGTMPPWSAGDEVYGQSGELRRHLERHRTGYVLRVPRTFRVPLPGGRQMRADQLAAKIRPKWWQSASVPGSKGDRVYDWAWVATASPRHTMLIRRNQATGEMAFHYCYVPEGRHASLKTLVRVACLRWPVEEGFEFGKDYFGLDHSQVRLYTSLLRHTVLAMAALAACAVTAAGARERTNSLPPMPTSRDEEPPDDPGLIPLTVNEVKRLYCLLTRTWQTIAHHVRWHRWRRRHQARAKWYHHRARLRRQADP